MNRARMLCQIVFAATVAAATVAAVFSIFAGPATATETAPARFVRIAQLQVDGSRLEAFAAAARELGQIAVREEPGCLALYAVAAQDDPAQMTVFEIYRDEAAYRAHLLTPHFLEFRATTDTMVLSRKLATAVPISLADRAF